MIAVRSLLEVLHRRPSCNEFITMWKREVRFNGRMDAKQQLHFSRHALPLTFVRNLAPDKGMRRIRIRADSRRNRVGIVSENHPIVLRTSSDVFMSLSRFPIERFLT